jgi:hypothetical protein
MKDTAELPTGRAADALPHEDGDASGEAEILVWNGRVADPSEGSDGDLVEGEAPSPVRGSRQSAKLGIRLAKGSAMR